MGEKVKEGTRFVKLVDVLASYETKPLLSGYIVKREGKMLITVYDKHDENLWEKYWSEDDNSITACILSINKDDDDMSLLIVDSLEIIACIKVDEESLISINGSFFVEVVTQIEEIHNYLSNCVSKLPKNANDGEQGIHHYV